MKIKDIYTIVVLISILALFSCAYPVDRNRPGIAIDLPMGQIYTIPDEDYFAQVYLLYNEELYPLGDDTVYIEYELDEEADQNRIIVENVPAATYILWLGIGIKREENGAFNVQYYYESGEFELVAGSTTEINCTLLDCPFDKALNVLGENINGVVINTNLPNNLYASGPKNLYSYNDVYNGPDFNLVEEFDETDFPNYDINSVSKGLSYVDEVTLPTDSLFLSTSTGISLWDGAAPINNAFSTDLGEVNVLKSLAYPDGNHVSVFFQRDGGLGGVYLDNNPIEWIDVDYSEILKDQLVWDFFVTENLGSNNGGYFATAFGSLKIPQSIIEDYDPATEDDINLMAECEFFAVKDGDEEIPIVSLGYDPDIITPTDSTVYMGTYEGLYYANVGATTALDGDPVLLDVTRGRRIYMVLFNDTYRAYMSQTYLFLQEKSSGDVVALPFVAGLPGDISAMDWHGNILVISGTLGLVTLDVDARF